MALGLLCSLLVGPVVWADEAVETTAWVSWVMDGDTVLLVREGQHEPVKLRIEGIDAPEICQPGGPEARDAMILLALRKPVQVTDHGQDVYGRQIGRLSVDGVDLGAEMVRSGMAWAYRFRTGRGPYAALQRQAQTLDYLAQRWTEPSRHLARQQQNLARLQQSLAHG